MQLELPHKSRPSTQVTLSERVVWKKWETNKLSTRRRGNSAACSWAPCRVVNAIYSYLFHFLCQFPFSLLEREKEPARSLVTLSFSNWQRTQLLSVPSPPPTTPPSPSTSLFSNCQIKTGKMLNLISEALKKRRNAEQASKTKWKDNEPRFGPRAAFKQNFCRSQMGVSGARAAVNSA